MELVVKQGAQIELMREQIQSLTVEVNSLRSQLARLRNKKEPWETMTVVEQKPEPFVAEWSGKPADAFLEKLRPAIVRGVITTEGVTNTELRNYSRPWRKLIADLKSSATHERCVAAEEALAALGVTYVKNTPAGTNGVIFKLIAK